MYKLRKKNKKLLTSFFKFPYIIFFIAAGAISGFFFVKTFIYNYQSHYTLNWEKGNWINLPQPSPQAYFRKKLYISSNIHNAWIKISAQDKYIIYVNRRKVGGKTFKDSLVSGIYDLTNILKKGENIIAIIVKSYSYPSTCKLIVEGAYTGRNHDTYYFFSDDSWKVYPVKEKEPPNPNSWLDNTFVDSHWLKPIQVEKLYTTEMYQAVMVEEDLIEFEEPERIPFEITVNPHAITEIPKGKWIWHPSSNKKYVKFHKIINQPYRTKESLIRISSNQIYKLFINGFFVKSNKSTAHTLDIFNITPFLRKGKNRIEIQVEGKSFPYGMLTDILIASSDGKEYWYASDSSWKVSSSKEKNKEIDNNTFSTLAKAEVIGQYGDYPWKGFHKKIRNIKIPKYIKFRIVIHYLFYIILFTILIIGLNLFLCRIYLKIPHTKTISAINLAAIINLALISFWTFMFIIKFDTRLHPSFTYKLYILLIGYFIVLLLFALAILERLKKKNRHKSRLWKRFSNLIIIFNRKNLDYIVILIVIVIGFYMRINNLDYESLNTDEVQIIQQAQYVLYNGYPASSITNIPKTYLFLSYPIAYSYLLFGESDFTSRLPSAIMGCFVIFLLYYISRKLLDKRIGILAAAIYAFNPWAIHWAKNVTYPQTIQFLILLVSYFFYIGIKEDKIKKDYIYLASLLFILAYYCWVGIGIFFPVLILGTILFKGKDWKFILNRHFFISGGIITFFSLLQLVRRKLGTGAIYVIGSGLARKTVLLSLRGFGKRNWFYFKKVMLSENHIILTIVLLMGLYIIIKHKPLKYFFILFLISILIMSNFIPNEAPRYIFFLHTFLILISSAVIIYLMDLLKAFQTENSKIIQRISITFTYIITIMILFFSSNSFFLQLYHLSFNPQSPNSEFRYGIYTHYSDIRSSCQFIKENSQPGDKVITQIPNVAVYYLGNSDYMLETIVIKAIHYGSFLDTPIFMAKKGRNTIAITDLASFKDILNRNPRIWVIAAPSSAFNRINNRDVIDYIKINCKLVYESYYSKVYLWEK